MRNPMPFSIPKSKIIKTAAAIKKRMPDDKNTGIVFTISLPTTTELPTIAMARAKEK